MSLFKCALVLVLVLYYYHWLKSSIITEYQGMDVHYQCLNNIICNVQISEYLLFSH